MKAYKQHVRSDATKWVLTAIAIVLIAVMLTAIITDGFKDGNPYCWFGHDFGEDDVCTKCGAIKEAEVKEDEQPKENNKTPVEENPVEETPVDDEPLENGGADVTSIRNEGNMRLAVKRGVQTPVGENTYVLTATIAPAEADNVNVTWAVAWKNPSSTFATGKNVTDYVTVAAQSGNNLNATVTCKQAFGEQVIVTVTSVDNAAAKASCTVDYVERITGINFVMPTLTSTSTTISYDFETTPCTIKADLALNLESTRLATSDEFYDAYLDAVLSTVSFKISNGNTLYLADCVRACDPFISLQGKTLTLTADIAGASDSDFRASEGEQVSGLAGAFYVYATTGPGLPSLSSIHALMNSAFRKAINDFNNDYDSAPHATFDISFTSTYNGQTYSSGTKTVNVRLDAQSIHVGVASVSLNEDNIIF